VIRRGHIILNLDRSISDLFKKIERLDSVNSDDNDSTHWERQRTNSIKWWISLRGIPYALKYFPDDEYRTFLTESDLKNNDEKTRK
jgi:hypothetical protein